METTEKIKYPNLPVVDREEQLEANADLKEKTMVKRPYSSQELDEFREYVVSAQIKARKLEEELAELSQPLKDNIKSVKLGSNESFEKVFKGYEVQEVMLFGFKNYTSGLMEYFNAEGVWVSSRPLYGSERQTAIVMPMNKAVNQ